jgi:hypothetical protein
MKCDRRVPAQQVNRICDWVRKQLNAFARQHPGMFPNGAQMSAADFRRSTWRLVIVLDAETVEVRRLAWERRLGFRPDIETVQPSRPLELALDMAHRMCREWYERCAFDGWRDTPSGRRLLKDEPDLPSICVGIVQKRWREEMPGIEVAMMLPPAKAPPRKASRTLLEKRADKAIEQLKRWERKQRLAKTKVAHYRQKVNYYQQKGVQCDSSQAS